MEELKIQIKELNDAYNNKALSYKILLDAIDGLKKKEDVAKYFQAYKRVVKQDLNNNMKAGETSDAIEKINSGANIDDITNSLAIDKFAYVLNKYSDQKVHELWEAGVPSLYKNGSLQNLVGMFQ